MTYEEFENDQKESIKDVQGRDHSLRKTFTDAEHDFYGNGGQLDMSPLEEKESRASYIQKITDGMVQYARDFAANATLAKRKARKLASDLFGFSTGGIRDAIEQLKSKFNYEGFMDNIKEQYNKIAEDYIKSASHGLSVNDAPEIADKFGFRNMDFSKVKTISDLEKMINAGKAKKQGEGSQEMLQQYLQAA